ncbi:hypothetical protein [Thermococcus sp.]|uniref:hypothetical protein n=1 Tax=Thermococcus sp. TaxID=35749 RepID=UPI0026064002|nr:hypothetical protein [Thermococcus sp.]
MSCEEVEGLIKKIALALVVLFVSGFSVLYYAIRKAVPSSTNMYGADMAAIFLVLSALFFSLMAYTSKA